MEYRIEIYGILIRKSKQLPVLVSIKILTNNIEVNYYNHEISCEWIIDECATGAKWGPGKLANKEMSQW